MIRLHAQHHLDLSFPDEVVLAMNLNRKASTFVLGITGAFVDPDSILEGVRVELIAWTDLSTQLDGNPVSAEHLPDQLEWLNEFEVGPDRVRLAGFLRKGQGYAELTFLHPELSVEYVNRRNVQP